jgi:hypothetical protein
MVKSDHRHRRLLRAHGERPGCRTAIKPKSLSVAHSITSSARPSSETRADCKGRRGASE